MKGIFELRTTADLRRKLNREYERLSDDPTNSYIAFNLFLTAEHLLDWLHPGNANSAKRSMTRDASLILQICSHIANGAKHFEVEAKHHTSVSDTSMTAGYHPAGYYPAGYMPTDYFPESHLVVRLEGAARQKYGDTISAETLSRLIVDYWNGQPGIL
jgi:hypothetical protein